MRKLLYILLFVGFYSFAQSPAIQTKILRLEASSLIEMNAFTRMEEGSLCWRTDLKELFAYDGASWVQKTGLSTTYTAGTGLTESPSGTFNVENPFTSAEKTKLSGIDTGATAYDGSDAVKKIGSNQVSNFRLTDPTSGEFFINSNQIGFEYSSGLGVTIYPPSDGNSKDGNVALISEEGGKSSYVSIKPDRINITTEDNVRTEIHDDGGVAVRTLIMDATYNNSSDVPTKADVDAAIAAAGVGGGTDDQTAAEVPITDTADNFTATDVEGALAELAERSGVIVAEGTFITTSGTGSYIVSHGLGYIPSDSRIQIQELNTPSGLSSYSPSVSNITSTTFEVKAAPNTNYEYAWRIYGQGSVSGSASQTLSLSGTNNQDLTISNGNTVTVPSLSNADQSVGSSNRKINIDISGSLEISVGQETKLKLYGNGSETELPLLSDPYDSGWSNNFNPASKIDVYNKIESLVAGTDSGQAMAIQSKTDVTETFNNADVVNAGTATDKRKFTTFTGTNEITLDDTITLYNQPFLLFHKSATGSTTLKKGTGTTFIISDQGELTEDGVTFTDYANASVIALSSNEYLITCSTCSTYTESTAIYQGNNAADPNNEVDSVANTDNNSLFIITSVESSPTPQNGSSSLLFQQDNADNTSSDAYIELSGLDISKTYTITLYTQEVNGLNWVVGLDDSQGWGSDDLKSVSADAVWVQMLFSGSPSVTNPKIRINGTASSDLGDILAIDNIVITEQ